MIKAKTKQKRHGFHEFHRCKKLIREISGMRDVFALPASEFQIQQV
jgi:hypothetical protein